MEGKKRRLVAVLEGRKKAAKEEAEEKEYRLAEPKSGSAPQQVEHRMPAR